MKKDQDVRPASASNDAPRKKPVPRVVKPAPTAPADPRLPAPDPATPTLDVPGVVSIPLAEIKVSYSRSSGPGGQNVNKVSSKAQIRWNLVGGRLAPDVVERFKKLYPSYVT